MSSEYFRLYCQKKRSARKLAAWRVGVVRYQEKLLRCEVRLADKAASTTDASTDALIAAGKRARLIQYSSLRPNDDTVWEKVPRYIKLSMLPPCIADKCPQNPGEYAWMAHCAFLKRGGPYLCNQCACNPDHCNTAVAAAQKAWVARKLKKPYAAGLVLDETTGCVSEPGVKDN